MNSWTPLEDVARAQYQDRLNEANRQRLVHELQELRQSQRPAVGSLRSILTWLLSWTV